MKQQCKIILGSGSPRRKSLLTQWGLEIEVQKPFFNEACVAYEGDPVAHVQALALGKMESLQDISSQDAVLTADTLVVYDRELLGKPATPKDARSMLQQLSGQTHRVVTGYALTWKGQRIQQAVSANVTFAEISDTWLDMYVAHAQWQDKAGGYGIQEHAGGFVTSVEGAMDTIIGLPMVSVMASLQELGVVQ